MGRLASLAAPLTPRLFVAAALRAQLCGVCNLVDGMLELKDGRGTSVSALCNEAQDGVSVGLFLAA